MESEQAINEFSIWIDSDYDNRYIPSKISILKAYEALKSQKSFVDYLKFFELNGYPFQDKNT